MSQIKSIELVRQQFENAGQSHVLTFWNELTETEQDELLSSLQDVNLHSSTHKDENVKSLNQQISPLSPECVYDTRDKKQVAFWRFKGLELIANNKVAVILLAGGQGTRLGTSEPKGCFDIGLDSKKSLFQLQAERILKVQELARVQCQKNDVVIPWYIMVSRATHKATKSFFRSHGYFGVRSENVVFFEQDSLPAMDFDGKFLLETKSSIVKTPNGNGGLYRAVVKHGILHDMELRGCQYVHVYCVDNALVKVADPVFIGFCAENNVDLGVKAVEKTYAEENVGVFCRCDGKPHMVEYSEMDSDMQNLKDDQGKLVYNAANIANHFYTTDFLRRVSQISLEYHPAVKKIPHIDLKTGQQVKPLVNNGIKLELFIIDVISFAERFSVLFVDRSEEFSPVKNAVGVDSPQTAKNDLLAQSKRYLEAAGFITEHSEIELSPLVTYDGEGLDGTNWEF